MTTYDVVIIGAGPAGENVADRVVAGGLDAVIVERELVGGECSYWACMPTKALLRTGAALRAAVRAGATGTLDPAAVLRRRDGFASHWTDDGQVTWLAKAGIDLVRGHGRIAGPRTVTVTDAAGKIKTLTARYAVVVATGSTALLPEVPGLAESEPWTSREAAAASEIPARLAIIGGGVVATEMATAFATLGSEVTVLARGGILPSAEPFAGELVTAALREAGVTVLPDVDVTEVRRDDTVRITLSTGEPVVADQVLITTGRTANTADLGLETVGLEPGTWLTVDDTLQVTDWLYAVGDVNHRSLVTHQGKYQARIAGDAIVAHAAGAPFDNRPWGRHVATADRAAVSQVIFTDPEIASAGLTAATAERSGYRIRVVDYDLAATAGAALHADAYTGRARMIVDEDRRVVLGVTFAGPDAAELIHAATIAITAEVPIDRLWHAVPAFPTISEVWLRLLETYGRQPPTPDDTVCAPPS